MDKEFIPEIIFPKVLEADLYEFPALWAKSTSKEDIDSGQFNLGQLNPRQSNTFFFLRWVVETNEIIKCLNLVLLDLRSLPQMFSTLGGAPWLRYQILVRNFYSEFYRLREIFNTCVAKASKRGLVEKREVEPLRSYFNELFEGMFKLRNALIHASVQWSGPTHNMLALNNAANRMGMALGDIKTGKPIEVEKLLEEICGSAAKPLLEESQLASSVLEKVIYTLAETSVLISAAS